MENKRILIVMLIALPLMLLWEPMWMWIGTKMGYDMTPKRPTTQVVASQPATAPEVVGLPNGNIEAATQPGQANATGAISGLRVVGGEPVQPALIGSDAPDDANYAVGVYLSPRGAAIESVTLNRYKKQVDSPTRYVFQQPFGRFVDQSRPLGSGELVVTVDGTQSKFDLSKADWSFKEKTKDRAVLAVDIANETGPLLRAIKTYAVTTRDAAEKTSGGYEIAVELKFENLSSKPLTVNQKFVGPLIPPKELDRGNDRNVIGGYVESGKIFRIRHDYTESFTKSKPVIDYSKSSNGDPLIWAGACSVYFNAILRPDPIAGSQSITPDYIAKVEGRTLDPDTENAHDHHVITEFQTTDLNIAAGQSVAMPMRFFTGPRLRSLMNNPYFSQLPLKYDETLVLTGGPCAWCTFQWLVNILVGLLGYVQFVVRDWGIAIIVLVLLVRTLLHPITKKSQINMMGMSKFGPELERIKKKYADDKDELNRAMMQFYKEHGATPLLGCLPMMLQTPIWIALFSALQSTFELRQSPFLQFGNVHLTWINDLSQPDHLLKLKEPFTIFFLTISGLNILPLLLAVVFYIQQKLTPKPPAMSPEQEQQQKMMQWMPLMFPIFLYGGPSGLNLYILASTTFGIIESKIIRNHIKQREEAEKAGGVIVDAADTPRGKRQGLSDTEPKKKEGWLARKMAEMQKRVEEIQKQAEKQQRGRKK